MDLFNQADLFSTNKPQTEVFNLPDADITLYKNLFTAQESNQLYNNLKAHIKWQQDKIQFYGKFHDVPRLAAWYGDGDKSYTYSGITMHPHVWNDDLIFIKNRIEAQANIKFTSCLLNYYRTGKDSMNWHQDNEKELGLNPIIGSVTFGETRPFQLKHLTKTDLKRIDIPLTHGSFLLMKGTTQHYWKHKIPKTTKNIKPRINLTFRIIVDHVL